MAVTLSIKPPPTSGHQPHPNAALDAIEAQFGFILFSVCKDLSSFARYSMAIQSAFDLIHFKDLHALLLTDPFYGIECVQPQSRTQALHRNRSGDIGWLDSFYTRIVIEDIYRDGDYHRSNNSEKSSRSPNGRLTPLEQFKEITSNPYALSEEIRLDYQKHLIYLWCGYYGLPADHDRKPLRLRLLEFLERDITDFAIYRVDLPDFLRSKRWPVPVALGGSTPIENHWFFHYAERYLMGKLHLKKAELGNKLAELEAFKTRCQCFEDLQKIDLQIQTLRHLNDDFFRFPVDVLTERLIDCGLLNGGTENASPKSGKIRPRKVIQRSNNGLRVVLDIIDILEPALGRTPEPSEVWRYLLDHHTEFKSVEGVDLKRQKVKVDNSGPLDQQSIAKKFRTIFRD